MFKSGPFGFGTIYEFKSGSLKVYFKRVKTSWDHGEPLIENSECFEI